LTRKIFCELCGKLIPYNYKRKINYYVIRVYEENEVIRNNIINCIFCSKCLPKEIKDKIALERL